MQPYDGARVTVLVQGMKDITWYQYQILGYLEQFWNTYLTKLNDTIFQTWYQNIRDRINDIPEVVDSAIITTWNYTNIDGTAKFTLGKNDDYIFLVQSPSTTLPWPLSTHTKIRQLKSHEDKSFQVVLTDFSRKPLKPTMTESIGINTATLFHQATWNQIHQNIKNRNIGLIQYQDDISVYFMDTTNFKRYQQGKSFQILQSNSLSEKQQEIHFGSDLYVIFMNQKRHTSVTTDINLEITAEFDGTMALIDQPRSSIFSNPIFSVGDIIEISGSSSHSCHLIINGNTIQFQKDLWFYQWNTTGQLPGLYDVELLCMNKSDMKTIELVDKTPPELTIFEPIPNQLYLSTDSLTCHGSIFDASAIQNLSFFIDDIKVKVINSEKTWNISIDLLSFSPGVHTLSINAIDIAGNTQWVSIQFIIKDDTSLVPPLITNVSSQLTKYGNWSTITITANGKASSIYPLKEMNIHYIQDESEFVKKMFIYGINPEIDRHIEDPYVNISNQPMYGCFLGDFDQEDVIEYWIEAIDVSNTKNITSSFIIEL